MLMEIKGDLGLCGHLHGAVWIELLDNGDFQTLSSVRQGELCHFDCSLSPHFLPPCRRDVLKHSGRELITKSLSLQFSSPLEKVVAIIWKSNYVQNASYSQYLVLYSSESCEKAEVINLPGQKQAEVHIPQNKEKLLKNSFKFESLLGQVVSDGCLQLW